MRPLGPHIKTTFRPDGTTIVEPVGFPGGVCRLATAPYDKAFGPAVQDTPTAEAFEPEPARAYDSQSEQQEIR